jgi:hypothetical protein
MSPPESTYIAVFVTVLLGQAFHPDRGGVGPRPRSWPESVRLLAAVPHQNMGNPASQILAISLGSSLSYCFVRTEYSVTIGEF